MQDERIASARQMRDAGKLYREIGAELGVTGARVSQWLRATPKACACGCGGETRARYIFGHQTRRNDPYHVDAMTGCWVWVGAKDLKGYGSLHRDGRQHRAHRWYYERSKGSIPEGLELDHLCRNPACVNPDHLEAVTPAQNTQRGMVAKLTWDDVREIRASGLSGVEIARRWGISESNVSMVLRGQTWKEPA